MNVRVMDSWCAFICDSAGRYIFKDALCMMLLYGKRNLRETAVILAHWIYCHHIILALRKLQKNVAAGWS